MIVGTLEPRRATLDGMGSSMCDAIHSLKLIHAMSPVCGASARFHGLRPSWIGSVVARLGCLSVRWSASSVMTRCA